MFGFLLKRLLIATSFLNMTINDLDNIIKRMQLYQKWRRGDTDVWHNDPTLLGKDIDAVIGVCKSVRDFLGDVSEKNFKIPAGGSPEEPS